MQYSVIIVAAGSGTRCQLGYNKVYYKMNRYTILENAMKPFLKDNDCKQIIVVTDIEDYRSNIHHDYLGKVVLVSGGQTRQESVMNGLHAVVCDTVMVHDGARPFLCKESLESLKQAMETERAACLMVPVVDTVKVVRDGYVETTLERETLMNAQTPQAFQTKLLCDCMSKALQEGYVGTDDCSLIERYSDVKVKVVLGDNLNKKITSNEDIQTLK